MPSDQPIDSSQVALRRSRRRPAGSDSRVQRGHHGAGAAFGGRVDQRLSNSPCEPALQACGMAFCSATLQPGTALSVKSMPDDRTSLSSWQVSNSDGRQAPQGTSGEDFRRKINFVCRRGGRGFGDVLRVVGEGPQTGQQLVAVFLALMPRNDMRLSDPSASGFSTWTLSDSRSRSRPSLPPLDWRASFGVYILQYLGVFQTHVAALSRFTQSCLRIREC